MMLGKATLRGGQTLLHDVHMWGQLVRWQILGLLLVVVLVPSTALFRTTTGYEWRLVVMGTLAEFKLSIGYSPRSGQMHEWREGRKSPTRSWTSSRTGESNGYADACSRRSAPGHGRARDGEWAA